jgi:hypothetical protein
MPAVTPGGVRVSPKASPENLEGGVCRDGRATARKTEDANKKAGEGESRKRKRMRVASALQWVECFHSYIGVVAQLQPDRVTDLLGYASLIVHAARKFKGEGWMQYDRNFRKHAETHTAARWSEANTTLGP